MLTADAQNLQNLHHLISLLGLLVFPATVWGVVGNIGFGKTLLATFYAKLWEAHKKNVYANYHVIANSKTQNLVHHMTSNDFTQLNKLINALAVLDEAYEWLESRSSGSDVNRILSHGVLQSRKRGVDLLHTAQLASTVDLRLRRVTSTLIWATRPDEDGFHYMYFAPSGNISRTLDVSVANKLFQFYDTKEIVGEASAEMSGEQSEDFGELATEDGRARLMERNMEQDFLEQMAPGVSVDERIDEKIRQTGIEENIPVEGMLSEDEEQELAAMPQTRDTDAQTRKLLMRILRTQENLQDEFKEFKKTFMGTNEMVTANEKALLKRLNAVEKEIKVITHR